MSSTRPVRITEPTPRGASGRTGVALAAIEAGRDLLRVGVVQRHRHDAAAPVEQVDRAPVGELRDGQPRDVAQGLLVVERRGEQVARLGEEALAALGVLGLGDVLDDVHGEPLLVVEQGRLREQPALARRVARCTLRVSSSALGSPASSRLPGRSSSVTGRPSSRVIEKRAASSPLSAREDLLDRRRRRAARPPRGWRRPSGRRRPGRSPPPTARRGCARGAGGCGAARRSGACWPGPRAARSPSAREERELLVRAAAGARAARGRGCRAGRRRRPAAR